MNYKHGSKNLVKMTLLVIFLGVANVQSEVVVVVSANSSLNELSKSQVAKIFLGKSRRFPDGSPAKPLNQSEGNLERDAFYQLVSGKEPAQVKAHWSKLIFTGRGQPPKEAPNNSEVKHLLANNKANIGYINRSAMDDTVKIVALK